MKIDRRWFLGLAVVLLPLFLLVVVNAKDDREETTVRWDIVSIQPPPPYHTPQCFLGRDGIGTGQ